MRDGLDEYTITHMTDLIQRLPTWRITVLCRGAHKVTQKMAREIEEVLTVDDIRKLESTEYVRKCLGIIEEAQRGQPCNHSMFADVRDYLTTMLTLQNGSRTGVVENITMEDNEKGKKDRDGNFVCTVDRHKKPAPSMGQQDWSSSHVYICTQIYTFLQYEATLLAQRGRSSPTSAGRSLRVLTWEKESHMYSRKQR